MNLLEDIVISLYGKEKVKLISANKVLCRNRNLSFDLRNGKQLFIKYFFSKRHFERESFLYKLFEKNKLLLTPKLEHVGDNFFILQRLALCPDPSIYKIIKDIAKLHGGFSWIETEVNEKLKEQVLFKVDESNIKQILENINFYSVEVEDFLRKGSTDLPFNSQRLTHGDLYINNVLIDARKNLRYIDLENAKVDYPEKDNVLIALHNQESYQEIINFYCRERSRYEKINKKEVKFAMRYLTVLKLSEMLHNLNEKGDKYTNQLRKTEFVQEFRKRTSSLIKNLIVK